MSKIWFCKIGEIEEGVLPSGSDSPMRNAVEQTYQDLTGQESDFLFSGWSGYLTELEYNTAYGDPVSKNHDKGWDQCHMMLNKMTYSTSYLYGFYQRLQHELEERNSKIKETNNGYQL